ncbi:MAG: AIR synthase-related protein, partial [Euryarchaeota archaeon]|nr:AIR synthase-related protein [Euryarchaeota archaeon]
EIASASKVGVVVDEGLIPIRDQVRAVCDLLGFDPYYLANEGRLIAFVPEGEAKEVLQAMQTHPLGREATIIGRVVAEHPGKVLLKTEIGGHRLLDPLSGEQFPRIC